MQKLLLLTLLAVIGTPISRADTRLSLVTQTVTQQEGGTLTCHTVKAGGHEFHFLPPSDWRVTIDEPAQKVFLSARDGSVQFTFKIAWAAEGKPAKPDVAGVRAQILERYPDARITEEFTAHADNESGPAFDLTYTTAKKFPLASRMAFIPFESGVVEFELVARPEIFPKHAQTFGRLLNSFQIEPINKTARGEPPGESKILPSAKPDATK